MMETSSTRRPLLARLYNHNPFYVISAVTMLYAVRNQYGELKVGEIDCWAMMGILAAYTTVLAAVSILIVRWGKVWEDARSLVLLLLLLFLAVSVSADDLFVHMESASGGMALLIGGFLFAAVVTELVLFCIQLKLGLLYRLPLHLLVLLFFVAPWWCAPALHQRSAMELKWTLMAFPVAAAGLFLLLFPAVRRGPCYVNRAETPWKWPLYPWTAFGMLGIAIALRSFALCMTFGPTGPIWIDLPTGARAIAFDLIWGAYFLIPLAWAVLLLMLEASFVTGHKKWTAVTLKSALLLIPMAVPLSNDPVFREFLNQFTQTIASPLWLTVWGLILFYIWAYLRGASEAFAGLFCGVGALSVVGPQTHGFHSLTVVQPWPIALVGLAWLVRGARQRASFQTFCGAVILSCAAGLMLPHTIEPFGKFAICTHLVWLAAIVVGIFSRDLFSSLLRFTGVAMMPLATYIILFEPITRSVSSGMIVAYLATLAIACLVLAKLDGHTLFWWGFFSMLAVELFAAGFSLYHTLVSQFGRTTILSFGLSAGSFLVAFLISSHKARWLPDRFYGPDDGENFDPSEPPQMPSPAAIHAVSSGPETPLAIDN